MISNSRNGLNVRSLASGSHPLGTLYDVRSSTFRNATVFKNKISVAENFSSTDCPTSKFLCRSTDSLHEIIDLLEIDASVNVKLLISGDASASGRFLKSTKSSRKEIKMTLLYSIRTNQQSFEYNDERFRDHYDEDILSCSDATHYVGKIIYGGNAALTLTYKNLQNQSKTDIESGLRLLLQSVGAFASGEVAANHKSESNHVVDKTAISFCIESDSNESSVCFSSIEDANHLMQEIVTGNKLKMANDNKGSVVEYVLYPLSDFDGIISRSPSNIPQYELLSEKNASRLCSFFNEIRLLKLEFEETSTLMDKYQSMFCDSELLSLKFSIGQNEATWVESISNSVIHHKDGHSSSAFNLCILRVEAELQAIRKQLTELNESINNKVALIDSVKDLCIYVGKGKDYKQYCSKDCFVLTFTHRKVSSLQFLWQDNIAFLRTTKAGYILCTLPSIILLDLEFADFPLDNCPVSKIAVHRWHNNEWKFDLLAHKSRDRAYACLVGQLDHLKASNETLKKSKENVVIPCPTCKCDQLFEWFCFSCKVQLRLVEIDGTQCYFCGCGTSAITNCFKYCCRSVEHHQYLPYPTAKLTAALNSMTDKTITILLFGNSGVGKTTFVNSLANYMKETTLKKMYRNVNQLVSLVYASYEYSDAAGATKTATIGEETTDEVVTGSGESATQKCKTYIFSWSNRIIKIVDTPGVNDTRGLMQDFINCNNIMGYLNHFNKVHAFLFLVDAKESRLTHQFKHCFFQFAEKLHVSAIENIVFIYTKCHGEMRTNKARPLLEALMHDVQNRTQRRVTLGPNNQYSFDNDCFEWLVCIKNGMAKSMAVFLEKEKSWDFSRNNAFRMLNYIKDNHRPHDISQSVSVHLIRTTFYQLSLPIAALMEVINENKLKCSKLLAKLPTDIDELGAGNVIALEQIKVEVDRLPFPRTVCTDPSCSTEKIAYDGTKFRIFRHVCEDSVTRSTSSNVLDSECFAPNHDANSMCTKCGHSWSKHINTFLDYKKNISVLPGDSKQRELSQAVNVRALLDQLEHELQTIFAVAEQLAQYLAENSIVPNSDVLGALIEAEIASRKMCAESPSEKKALKDMEDFKQRYDIQMKFAKENALSEKPVEKKLLTLEEMLANIKKLYDLKEYGYLIERSVMVQRELPMFEIGAEFNSPVLEELSTTQSSILNRVWIWAFSKN